MPVKSTNSAATTKSAGRAKTTKASTGKRTASQRTPTKKRRPGHGEIAERAYFIHLEEGSSDELANWLRAERELTPA
jgi:hypothetical protein